MKINYVLALIIPLFFLPKMSSAENTQTTSKNSGFESENTGINFQDADIRAVIEAVAKLTDKNFIVDPRVKGKVTLISPNDISIEKLYDIFLSILKVHGYIATEDIKTGVITILPSVESKVSAGLEESTQGSPDEIILRLIMIKNSKAAELVPILRPLISKTGHLAAHVSSNNIIVTDTRNNIEKIEKIIKRMDRISKSEIKIIKLRNATASEVVKLLNTILQKSGMNAAGKGSTSFSIVAEERTNSIVLRGNPIDVKKASRLLRSLDSPANSKSGTAVIKLKYAQAANIEKIIGQLVTQGDGKTPLTSAAKISIDEKHNSVIVKGMPKEVSEIRGIINKIDVKRLQIMVEALVVEMNADKSTQLGIQWAAVYDDEQSADNISITSALGAVIGRIKSGNYLTFGVVAQALANDTNANLVSAPSILTLENEEAVIEIGREVPFVTGSYTSTGSSSNPDNPFTTINRENVGLKLKITPQVNADNTIKLSIEQEISNILPGAQSAIGAADVVTSKRLIKTNALVKDGHMLVLGGLIDDNVRESENRTPGLSKIPLLGYFFKSRGTTKEKRNLMIFIRPHIIRNNISKELLTKKRYNYMRELQRKKSSQGVALMPNEQQPLIKDIYGSDVYRKPADVYRKPRTTKTYRNRMRPFRQNKGNNYDVLNPDYDN